MKEDPTILPNENEKTIRFKNGSILVVKQSIIDDIFSPYKNTPTGMDISKDEFRIFGDEKRVAIVINLSDISSIF